MQLQEIANIKEYGLNIYPREECLQNMLQNSQDTPQWCVQSCPCFLVVCSLSDYCVQSLVLLLYPLSILTYNVCIDSCCTYMLQQVPYRWGISCCACMRGRRRGKERERERMPQSNINWPSALLSKCLHENIFFKKNKKFLLT